jgi:phosphatidylglycerol:prolipoprotein diacylglycerol transferase
VTVGIEPLVVQLGPVVVRPFVLLALVGLLFGIWLALRSAGRAGLRRGPILDALAWAIPVGVLCARLVDVLSWWDYYLTRPADLWRLEPNGLSLWGGLVGGGLVAAAVLRRDPMRRRRIFDVAAPAVLVGIAIAQLGAFLDGYGQGVPSDLPWATRYTSPLAATPDFGITRHPVQLYDALGALALFGLMQRLPSRWRMAGLLTVYGGLRLVLGGIRLEPAFLFGLQIEQILAAGAVVVGVVYGLRQPRRAQVAAPSTQEVAQAA